MWLGTKRMERLAKAHLSPISKPRHINSIFKNECYSTVNQSISKKHPIVPFILWAKQRINRFWSKKMCRNSTFTFAPRPQKKVSSLLLFNTYLVMWKYNCEPLWLSGYNTEIIVGNVFGECHAPYTLKISFVASTKVFLDFSSLLNYSGFVSGNQKSLNRLTHPFPHFYWTCSRPE
jgi:hypothetical protein